MNVLGRKFAIVFGLCAITVSLCSGCAVGSPSARSANLYDMNYFQPDCKVKEQQIAFLQSLRRGPEDQIFSLSGWFGLDAQLNWSIDTNLRYLVQYC